MGSPGLAEILVMVLSGAFCLGILGVVVFIAVRLATRSGKRDDQD